MNVMDLTDKKHLYEFYSYYYEKCHEGPIEIIKNLFLGSKYEASSSIKEGKFDVAVPLDSVSGSIWEKGWRGEIFYMPIRDYNVLPTDLALLTAKKIIDYLKADKKVMLFCIGGHGRTGYIASIVLGLLGYEDPIKFIRENYCKKAVESASQIEHIANLLNNPKLKEYKPAKLPVVYTPKTKTKIEDDLIEDDLIEDYLDYFCIDCSHFEENEDPDPDNIIGICKKFNEEKNGFQTACQHIFNADSEESQEQGFICLDCDYYNVYWIDNQQLVHCSHPNKKNKEVNKNDSACDDFKLWM